MRAGEGNGNPLQYSCLENPMDRGARQAMVHMVVKSQKWLKQVSRQAVQTCVFQGSIVFLSTCILLFLILWKTLANADVFLGTQKTWGLICRYPRPALALSFLSVLLPFCTALCSVENNSFTTNPAFHNISPEPTGTLSTSVDNENSFPFHGRICHSRSLVLRD